MQSFYWFPEKNFQEIQIKVMYGLTKNMLALMTHKISIQLIYWIGFYLFIHILNTNKIKFKLQFNNMLIKSSKLTLKWTQMWFSSITCDDNNSVRNVCKCVSNMPHISHKCYYIMTFHKDFKFCYNEWQNLINKTRLYSM